MAVPVLDLPRILDRLAATSRRPRYAMMVLNLLSEAADHRGQAGPFVTRGGETLPVRLWLGETLARMAVRHPRRRAMRERVAATVPSDNPLPLFGKFLADEAIDRAVAERARPSGGTNVRRDRKSVV